MSGDLDRWMNELDRRPPDRDLVTLEYDVQQRIARAPLAWVASAPLRAATVGMALVLGIGIGGLTAAGAAQPRPSLFAAADALAPSTLLDGG